MLRNSPDVSPTMPMMLRMRHAVAVLAILFAASLPATPAMAESDSAFAYRLCGLFHSPVGFPPATGHASFGAGSGCTWTIGNGDVGTTATEMRMIAWRDAGPALIKKTVQDFDDLHAKFASVPGYRRKDIAIACDLTGAPAKMFFWGIPSKSNMMGYAVCGAALVYGEIHSPPDIDMDTEAVFLDMMKTTAGAINCCAAYQQQGRPKTNSPGTAKPRKRKKHS
jgi:hypothetical protein